MPFEVPPGYVPIHGPTYSVRDRLKALGGYWDAEARVWWVPPEAKGEALQALRTRPAEWRSPNRYDPEPHR